MPAVFVHGVPDTHRLWDLVLRELPRTDVVTLSLPGFDSPVPDGFKATKEEYVDWIIGQLEQQAEPVDLVGHDWGCIMTARVASLRPDLVRTWAGGSGSVSKDYEWHERAKIWQTPGAGEEFMAKFDADQYCRIAESIGIPSDIAKETGSHINDTMKDCILRLYRSAVTVGSEWQPGLASVTAPALVFWGTSDKSCPVRFADSLAHDTRARRLLKFDAQHWVPTHKPSELAAALQEHWKTADAK